MERRSFLKGLSVAPLFSMQSHAAVLAAGGLSACERKETVVTPAPSSPAVVSVRGPAGASAAPAAAKEIEELQKNWKALLASNADVAQPTPPLERSKAEWRQQLTPIQYDVLREEGTERPGSSPLNAEKRPGVFVCAGCSLPLFTSAMKYESGTGWPSFFTSIPGAFAMNKDFKLFLPRTEYHCVKCGGHHGHVFDDGPPPTRQRWCNNGVALRFIPKTT